MTSNKPLDRARRGLIQKDKIKPKPKKTWVIFFILIQLPVGIYLLFNVFYPRTRLTPSSLNVAPKVQGITTRAVIPDNKLVKEFDKLLVIPKINIVEPIFQKGKSSLNKGIWHKFSDRSDPQKGGNFVLTGHRFTFGMTPDETLRKSPLYNVDKLVVGDKIKVKWNGQSYDYNIYSIKEVPKTEVKIEDQTKDDILTLYTCTFIGEDGPRFVIRARPI